MSWEPPANLTEEADLVYDYVIEWSLDKQRQEDILISYNHSYTFKNLLPGQLLTAGVRALATEGKHGGPLSDIKEVLLPGGKLLSYCSYF